MSRYAVAVLPGSSVWTVPAVVARAWSAWSTSALPSAAQEPSAV
ncbi:hypothetical protein [Amycolatopsis sp. YIM 10]|nr:hypothetical protein [Amycolatopsis sp. YIM 10]QFU91312.1 hypothetical protein YIM_30730 [Amycolatopsis sp. YIM 10]